MSAKTDVSGNKPRTLTRKERRKLIERPLPTVQVIGGFAHAGFTFEHRGMMPHAADTYPDVTLWRD